jgi:hypothetical protein
VVVVVLLLLRLVLVLVVLVLVVLVVAVVAVVVVVVVVEDRSPLLSSAFESPPLYRGGCCLLACLPAALLAVSPVHTLLDLLMEFADVALMSMSMCQPPNVVVVVVMVIVVPVVVAVVLSSSCICTITTYCVDHPHAVL